MSLGIDRIGIQHETKSKLPFLEAVQVMASNMDEDLAKDPNERFLGLSRLVTAFKVFDEIEVPITEINEGKKILGI